MSSKKTIVVYKSSAGFTKAYADWIAESLECQVISLKDATINILSGYDVIVYGGGIRANMINGLDKLKKRVCDKIICVFAVGASDANQTLISEIKKINQTNLSDLPFYYFRGGLQIDKLHGIEKIMMNMIKKFLSKKVEISAKEKEMLEMLSNPCDLSNREAIKPLIVHVNSL
ncbi:MAG: flavodoxin domain-containing protein [Oscillospiraceae bacterium]